MTDRISGLIITLDKDYRDDDVQSIVDAITMIKGVSGVNYHVVDVPEHIARSRVRHIIEQKLHDSIHEICKVG